MKKEVKKLMKQNDMILIRHKNHCIWQHNTLKFKVVTSKTASDHRSIKNIMRDINRGFALVTTC